MMHQYPTAFQRLALAAELTPPPSPDCNLKLLEDERPKANQGRLRRPRLPEPLRLVNSNRASNSTARYDGSEQKQPEFKDDIDPTFLDLTRNSSLAVPAIEPVSPLSSVYSDIKGSFEVSRPPSLGCSSPPTLASTVTSSSTTSNEEVRDITKEIPIIPKDNIIPADLISPDLTPQDRQERLPRPLFWNEPRKASSKPILSRLDTTFDSVQRHQRPFTSEKRLPPPPPCESPSPKTLVPDYFSRTDTQSATSDLRPPLQSEQILRVSQPLDGFGFDKPGRDYFSPPNTGFRHMGPPQAAATFPGVGATLRKVQPTYTVTVSAPKLGRRFSLLSSRSKSSSFPTDPFEPINTIAQKSNGVETGAMAYLPRYTNTFAGFCKNAWRLQIDEPDKAFNIRNKNSSSVPPTLKCRKCSFEAPLYPTLSRFGKPAFKKIPDSRVYSSYGILYTWQFLFKSHVPLKKKLRNDGNGDMGEGHFACIFCCAKGNGTPVFKGPEALTWHLRVHAGEGDSLDPELRMRYNIIIGRGPREGEAFDVIIPSLGGSALEDDDSAV